MGLRYVVGHFLLVPGYLTFVHIRRRSFREIRTFLCVLRIPLMLGTVQPSYLSIMDEIDGYHAGGTGSNSASGHSFFNVIAYDINKYIHFMQNC